MSNEALPSIEDVAARFTESAGNHTGGTSSDPNIPDQGSAPQPETKREEVTPTTLSDEEKKSLEPATKKPEKDISASRFAALARREREARERETAADKRVKEAEDRVKAAEGRESKWTNIKQNPLEALKEAGLTLSDVLNASYGKYEAPAEDPLDVKLKPLLERTGKAETQAESLLRQVEELKNQIAGKEQAEQYDRVMTGIGHTVSTGGDKYELISTMGDDAINLVRDVMVEYWKVNQKVLDYSEACDIVEKDLEERYLSPLSKTKKLQSRLGPQTAPKLAPSPDQKLKEPSSTLTNKLETAPQVNTDIDKMSKKEAIDYLTKKLQFK